jgi:hypothetical protein
MFRRVIQSAINKGRLRFSEAQQIDQFDLIGLDGKQVSNQFELADSLNVQGSNAQERDVEPLSEDKVVVQEVQVEDTPDVAEPPELYGPRAPVIALKTSKYCIQEPDNLTVCRVSSGNLNHPHLTTHTRINKGVTITLQHLLQKYTSECGRMIALIYKT